MIRGMVNANREAIVALRVRGPGGIEMDVNAVVDSGFTAALTLPGGMISALGLIRQSASRAILADGTVRQVDICSREVFWDGGWRRVLVSAVGDEVLLGKRMVAGHELRIAVRPGGLVEIMPLP